jgi:hypothetical protein
LSAGANRSIQVWQAWLHALATDAEAALAAALAYRDLDGHGRDAWLESLERDAAGVPVPKVAFYAPLLSVETDPARRARMAQALGGAAAVVSPVSAPRALAGQAEDGHRISVLIWPLYLDFVQVLACAYRVGEPFHWVRHDPILHTNAAPSGGRHVADTRLEERPVGSVVDELAVSVVAHSRSGQPLPEALKAFAHVFGLASCSPC